MKMTEGELMISDCRALDLTDDKGFNCGKILADLGVDVVKVEKPGGNASRKIGPFYHDIIDPEKSLHWFAHSNNTRGITLDIETSDGREIFKDLVKTADFIIESFPPRYMDNLGLGYAELSQINPGIIVVSITPFGKDGPYADYKASNLTCFAMAGVMHATGYPDREPTFISLPMAYMFGGASGAVGAMVAFYYRGTSGEGQQVDISIQDSLASASGQGLALAQMDKPILERVGPFRTGLTKASKQHWIWPCADGFVCTIMRGGKLGAPTNRCLMEWLEKEGICPEFLSNYDWDNWDLGQAGDDLIEAIEEPVAELFRRHTKREIYDWAIENRILLAPVYSPNDITEDPQLKERQFWTQVEHSELGTSITYPGSFIKSSEPLCSIRRRAPFIGEHNQEIYEGELGLCREKVLNLSQAGVI